MSNVLPYPLPKQKALEIVRRLSTDSGRIFYAPHARKRMVEREISMPDVMECLLKGQIIEGPAQMAAGAWRLTFSWFRAGSPLVVIAELDTDEDGAFLVVVTTIQKKR